MKLQIITELEAPTFSDYKNAEAYLQSLPVASHEIYSLVSRSDGTNDLMRGLQVTDVIGYAVLERTQIPRMQADAFGLPDILTMPDDDPCDKMIIFNDGDRFEIEMDTNRFLMLNQLCPDDIKLFRGELDNVPSGDCHYLNGKDDTCIEQGLDYQIFCDDCVKAIEADEEGAKAFGALKFWTELQTATER